MLKAFKKSIKNTRKMIKNSKGFTLLELIIVIAIIGFLVAMIAPRLEGIGKTASGTTDDGSSKVMGDILSRYQNETNKLPNKLGNLVPDGATAGSPIVSLDEGSAGVDADNRMIWDGTKTMGKIAAFDKSFEDKNKLYVHSLSPAEVKELKGMGITDFVDHTGAPHEIKAGTKVAMIGGGGATGTPPSSIIQNMKVGDTFGNPTLAYRIVLTISDESELITGGYMKKGGQSAVQGANEKYLKNTGYNIVLPKLKATFARMMDYTGTYPNITTTGYHEATVLELEEIGKSGVATGKETTTKIIGPDNSFMGDALIMSPTGMVGSGNGQSGYWEITGVKKELFTP